MRLPILLILFIAIPCALSKNAVKSLTESMGQEVIEIGAPIKELPPDIEEEPSAENEDDEKTTIFTAPSTTTKKELKKTTTMTTVLDGRRKNKDIDKNMLSEKQIADDEEARIEKELAEIYKDNLDYKADSSESVKEVTKTQKIVEKPIARSKNNFKFQPDVNSRSEIEKFRTSVDDISCARVTRLSAVTQNPKAGGNDASRNTNNFFVYIIPLAFTVVFK